MGRKLESSKKGTKEASKKESSRKGKEPQLPAPKRGKTDQTAPPNQAMAWKRSTMKDTEIQALVDAKLLQEQVVAGWRCSFGNPWMFETHPDETVVFARFVERGLALPTSDFFRGLLDYYSLQLVHLNPNGILHISIFVHLCEAFLGVEPHFNLFRKIFRLKPQPSEDDMQVIGGAGFQIREQYSDLYLKYELVSSHGSWKEKWFYIEDHKPSLPKITGHRPTYSSRWLDEPTTAESIQIPDLLKKIADLKEQGVTGVAVARSFLKRRVQPLQLRTTPGYEYSGLDDPSRMSSEDISDEEVGVRLSRMFRELYDTPVAVEEFNKSNKPNEVSSHHLLRFKYS